MKRQGRPFLTVGQCPCCFHDVLQQVLETPAPTTPFTGDQIGTLGMPLDDDFAREIVAGWGHDFGIDEKACPSRRRSKLWIFERGQQSWCCDIGINSGVM